MKEESSNQLKVTINVDDSSLDEMIEKANKLVGIIEEATQKVDLLFQRNVTINNYSNSEMKRDELSATNRTLSNEVLSEIIRKRSYNNRPLSVAELSFLIACKEILSDIKD